MRDALLPVPIGDGRAIAHAHVRIVGVFAARITTEELFDMAQGASAVQNELRERYLRALALGEEEMVLCVGLYEEAQRELQVMRAAAAAAAVAAQVWDECPICMIDFTHDACYVCHGVLTPDRVVNGVNIPGACGRRFHYRCLMGWVNTQPQPPPGAPPIPCPCPACTRPFVDLP